MRAPTVARSPSWVNPVGRDGGEVVGERFAAIRRRLSFYTRLCVGKADGIGWREVDGRLGSDVVGAVCRSVGKMCSEGFRR